MKDVFVSFWEKSITAPPPVEVETDKTEAGTKEWQVFIAALKLEAQKLRQEDT